MKENEDEGESPQGGENHLDTRGQGEREVRFQERELRSGLDPSKAQHVEDPWCLEPHPSTRPLSGTSGSVNLACISISDLRTHECLQLGASLMPMCST